MCLRTGRGGDHPAQTSLDQPEPIVFFVHPFPHIHYVPHHNTPPNFQNPRLIDLSTSQCSPRPTRTQHHSLLPKPPEEEPRTTWLLCHLDPRAIRRDSDTGKRTHVPLLHVRRENTKREYPMIRAAYHRERSVCHGIALRRGPSSEET